MRKGPGDLLVVCLLQFTRAGDTPSMTMPHILAVDDDELICKLISDYMTEAGLRVSTAANGREMMAVLKAEVIDLIVLDVRMPGEDGFSLIRSIRQTSNVPIIMLTGQIHEVDRVLGLELGADVYLLKPFSPRELLARIRAVLRRYESPASAEGANTRRDVESRSYRFAGWELSTGARKLVSPAGERVELTNGEYALLISFLKSPHQVLSRDQLLEGSRLHDDIYDRSIDVQILRLRRKIESDPNEPKLIKTERGAGYVFDCDVAG
jgi:DNA-binding response OmpR family regulator